MTSRRRFLKLGGAALTLLAIPAVDLERRASGARRAMGTRGRVVALHPEKSVAESAVDAALDEVTRLEGLLNPFDPGSEVGRLNRRGRLEEASPELLELLEEANRLSEATGGAFDVTVASGENDYRDVSVDGGRVSLGSGAEVDPGGIGVGYAVDSAVEELERLGVESGLVSIGGEVRVVGGRGRFSPWRIGIKDPDGGVLERLELRDEALATSGNYERPHVLDPHTGEPAEGCLSATVVSDDCLSADALSTAAYVAGEARGGEGCLILSRERELIRSGEV